MGHDAGTVAEIVVGDDPRAWRSIGFAIDDAGVCRVGATRIRLAGAEDERGRGLLGWALAGVVVPGDGPGGLDGLPTVEAQTVEAPPAGAPASQASPVDAPPAAPPSHPNGVVLIDHVVAFTPDLDRTTAAIETAGVAARRTREAGRGRLQRFFRLGEVVLELVGPAEPAGDGPAAFWGLAFTVADIDATAAALGERVGAPKTAVQPGRRIATLRKDDAISVPIAFMSAEDRRPVAGEPAGGTPRSDHTGRSGDTSL